MARQAWIIGTVWPEPESSAAGVRTWQLVRALLQSGWKVAFSSPSKANEYARRLEEAGVETHPVAVNDPAFDALAARLSPELCIFDRFMIEEQFGWRVRAQAPGCVRILDTVDLHFLRRAREEAFRRGASLEDLFAARIELRTDDALRELASIYRCDLSWVLSDFERELLGFRFEVPERLLAVSRFAYPPRGASAPALPGFEGRRHFAAIGNYRHPPNRDAVEWLRAEIWPAIRARLPGAELHLYGAYTPKDVSGYDDAATGFRVRGWAEDPVATLSRYRVSLAPLRFGAGIKGKIVDGWRAGTPVATTPIGAEGMAGGIDWGGSISRSGPELAEEAVRLHEDRERWEAARRIGEAILAERYDQGTEDARLIHHVERTIAERDRLRAANTVGAILWHQTLRSTEYFSRWIEAKNRVPATPEGAKPST